MNIYKYFQPRINLFACVSMLMFGILASATALAVEDNTDQDQVVAQRGTAKITLADVDAMVYQLPKEIRSGYMNSPERIQKLLDGMMMSRQIANEARAEGLNKRPGFERRVEIARDNLLMQMQLEYYLDNLKVPDFSVLAKEKYDADDSGEYGAPPSRDLSHILISTKSRDAEAAKSLAEDIRKRLDAGESFDALARQYSDDKGSGMSGDLTAGSFWKLPGVKKGQMVEPFEKAAWKLDKPGDFSSVVKTQFGFHVIRLDGINPATKRPFDQVKAGIEDGLRKTWLDERKAQYVASFQAQKLEADPEIVASLRTRYLPKKDAGVPEASGKAAKGR